MEWEETVTIAFGGRLSGAGPARPLDGLDEIRREIPVDFREFSCHFHDLKPDCGPMHVSRSVSKQKPNHVMSNRVAFASNEQIHMINEMRYRASNVVYPIVRLAERRIQSNCRLASCGVSTIRI